MTTSQRMVDPAQKPSMETPCDDKRTRSLASADLKADLRWQAVVRILASESFAKSPRLSAFLSYVAERTLLGREDEVTEQQIGVHVFGRPTDYNPGEDNIVRQTARQLRQRLALYYQEEGRDHAIQILIPRGGYTTQFQIHAPHSFTEARATDPRGPILVSEDAIDPPLNAADLAVELESDDSALRTERSTFPEQPHANQSRWCWLSLCAGILLGAALISLGNAVWQRHRHPVTSSDKLWSLLLRHDKKALVVLGDAGLNMYTNLAGHDVEIEDYAKQNYLHTPQAAPPPGTTWAPFATRRYIALSDLALVTKMLNLPDASTEPLDLRFARDIHFSDLENSNVILIGGPNYNPWVHAFDKNTDLQMSYDGAQNTLNVVNRAPKPGEMATYTESPIDPSRTGYALISLTDNVQGTGRVLLIEGTGMGGVETATDFLFNPFLMDPIVRKAELSHGSLANFDLLLRTTFYTGGNLRAEVVVFHLHAPHSQ